MQVRYEEATMAEYSLLNKIIGEKFPELVNAKFRIFFDLKKHISQGRIVLAQIFMSDDLTRLLTIDPAMMEEGADYCILLDFKLWFATDDLTKIRILRHELRHCRVESESKRPYKVTCHDIEDFVEEVKLNYDEPGWRTNAAILLQDMYSQEADQKK